MNYQQVKMKASVKSRYFGLIPLLVIALTLCFALPAEAKNFDAHFPEELLSVRLKKISKKSGTTILSDQQTIGNARVSALNATNLSVEQALERSLSGTPFTWKKTAETSYAVLKKQANQQPQATQGKGFVSGRITDENGEGLPGVNIRLTETMLGTVTDIEGHYKLTMPAGTYQMEISSIAYQKKKITDVEVKSGKITNLNTSMTPASNQLGDVVVSASYKKNSVNSLYLTQKNSAGMTNGISAEQIARTPDNNLGQVLKRITGVTTVDTRYVVVRGMTERYNQAMLDGVIIPSTDMNRRNFSFDIVPQELVNNVVVNKTASADLSAEFSGGQILINTLDIPEQNFTSLSLGTGYNTRTTGKKFGSLGGRGKSDFLGFDDGRRNMPMNLQSWTQRSEPIPSYAITQSKQFNNQQLKGYQYTASPNQNYRFSMGRLYQLDESLKFGFSGGLTYRNTQETNPFQTIRNSGFINVVEGQPLDTAAVRGSGNIYKFNTTLGGVLNAGIQGAKFKIASKNYYSHVFNETMQDASKILQDNSVRYRELLTVPEYTTVLQNKLEGENLIGSKGLKFNWTGSITNISQDIKDMRRLRYQKTATLGGVDYYDSPMVTNMHSDASGHYDSRLSTSLNETDYNWSASVSMPFNFLKEKSVVKAGYAGWDKKRSLNAATVQLVKMDLDAAITGRYEDIMAPDRMGISGDSAFYYAYDGRNGSQYTGTSKNHAVFMMLDQRFFQKLRLVYGVRAENFNLANSQDQFLRNPDNGFGNSKVDPFITGEKNWRFLPSVNATYSLTSNMNLRAAYSTTMVRPDFRETSYFELYDPYLDANIGGWNVVSTKIKNYDLRYEWYPSAGEIISVSAFYKDFDKPLEMTHFMSSGVGTTRYLRFQNQKRAINKGFEIEIRKRLDFIADKQWLRDLTIFGNGTWMKSEVEAVNYAVVALDGGASYELVATDIPGVKRPLYGQSPWIVNAGINYDAKLVGANISYNRSGYRSYVVNNNPNEIEYENGRNMVDLQLSARFLKQKAEIKLNISNLLDAETFYYTNPTAYKGGTGATNNGYELINGTDKFEADKGDKKTYRVKNGTTASVTLTYKF